MTNISVGTTRVDLRIAEPANNQPVQKTQEIKLRGINWSEKVARNDAPPPQDSAEITNRNSGSVPSNNDLPDIFSDNNSNIPQQNTQEETTQPPAKSSSGGSEMSTGIGMAVGGVSGALIGGKYGFRKLGIAIGVALGGLIGNKIGK